MKSIKRTIKKDILSHIQPNKVIVIYGPRQVGKTTLVKEILQTINEDYLLVNGEDITTTDWLSSQSIDILKKHIGNKKLLIIDEAQKIDKIGLNLKLIVDHIKDIKVIATGSSSFDLANQVGEPLVGRKWTYILYPIAQLELTREDFLETKSNLIDRLIYGSYPDVITSPNIQEKTQTLNELVNSYLYKDVLSFDGIKKADKIHLLLKKIAFQIGQEVSLQEVGSSLGIDSRTVEKYLDILEKSFIIKKVFGFSRNLRKEITKTSRFYFLDNGVRNAVINNFNDITSRDDIGQLWENYLFIERLKKQNYHKIYSNNYFWRTYDQKEVNLVEERDGKLFGYEFKWNTHKKIKAPKLWLDTYDNAEWKVITTDNYLDFVL
jgi:predicted AAA+ superfamily ATPase